MYILFAALFAFLLYICEHTIYKRLWNKNLHVDAHFLVNEAFVGDEASLVETIENSKSLPLPTVKMKLQLSKDLDFKDKDNSKVSDFFYRTDLYSIGPKERVKRTINFKCGKRGYYDFHGIDVVAADLLFSSEFVMECGAKSFLYVYPKPYRPKNYEPIVNRINGDILTKDKFLEDPYEFKGIREYQTFDSLKNVNWKASAKSESLMVNMHANTAEKTIRIFLNFENDTIYEEAELKELSISIAAALAVDYCKNGIELSLFSNAPDILTGDLSIVEGGSGDSHIGALNRTFARMNLSKKAVPFKNLKDILLNPKRTECTIVISPYMREDFQDLLSELQGKKKDFLWICPAYANSKYEVRAELKQNTAVIPAKEAMYELSRS